MKCFGGYWLVCNRHIWTILFAFLSCNRINIRAYTISQLHNIIDNWLRVFCIPMKIHVTERVKPLNEDQNKVRVKIYSHVTERERPRYLIKKLRRVLFRTTRRAPTVRTFSHLCKDCKLLGRIARLAARLPA
jgi:hypothetical protein